MVSQPNKSDQYTTGNRYFASIPDGEDVANVLYQWEDRFFEYIENTGYAYKWEELWEYYIGHYFGDTMPSLFGTNIIESGEQGEYSNLTANHFRNILVIMRVYATQSRPDFDVLPINADPDNSKQKQIAESLLEHEMVDKHVEENCVRAMEHALLFGQGFLLCEWDENEGELVDKIPILIDEDTGDEVDPEDFMQEELSIMNLSESVINVYDGDFRYDNPLPFDVIFDVNKRDWNDVNWVCVRRLRNKYQLAALYRDKAEEIKFLSTEKAQNRPYTIHQHLELDGDDVMMYDFYHRRSPECPKGRHVRFVGDTILFDSMEEGVDYPYDDRLPVIPLVAEEVPGIVFGYSASYMLLALQEAHNVCNSVLLTQQENFGIGVISVPLGQHYTTKEMSGMSILRYKQGLDKPEAMTFDTTQQSTIAYLQITEKQMETVSGISSIIRGKPDDSIKSGSHAALHQSMATTLQSGPSHRYAMFLEKLGDHIIKTGKKFINRPRMIRLLGPNNEHKVEAFTSEQLQGISGVRVDVGNPFSRTYSGRLAKAEMLMAQQMITPDQFEYILETGNLKAVQEPSVNEEQLIYDENAKMLRGEVPPTHWTDDDAEHIRQHISAICKNEAVRRGDEQAQMILQAFDEHVVMGHGVNMGLGQVDPVTGQLDPNSVKEGIRQLMAGIPAGPLPVGAGQPGQAMGLPGVQQAGQTPKQPSLPNLPAGTNPEVMNRVQQ